MAELNNTTQTQEPVYLNYGSNQIDQQAFLDAAANNVQQYVNNQTWSAKRKQKFLNAYSDIMSKGIIGANNTTGQWAVDLNNNIDLDSMDKKDQEMYHEAAYYILQQMKGITPREQQEEEKKSDLPVFNNDYFTEQFQGYIGNQLFGGRNWDRNSDWNVLDEVDKYGIRGTTNRAEKLANMLEGYRDSLKEEDLNFEGSPFTDLNDFKTRVNNAIDQLRNGTWDQNDVNALNQIGINPETYMSTGANDMNPEGTMTRQQWKEALEKQEADKLAAEQKDAQAKALAQQRANAGVLTPISGIHAVEAISQAPVYAEYLGKTYGVGEQGFNAINTAIQGLIEKGYNNGKGGGLTNAEKKQLGNLLYYVRQNNPNYQKSNLSDQDWAELNLHKNLGSTNRAGYVRLPWQTSDGRYTYADDKGNVYFLKPQNKAKIAGPAFNRSTAYNDYKNNFLLNTKTGIDKQQENYLKSIGFNDADIAELTGIGLDIASIVNPEPITAGLFGVGAAGARNYARTRDPKNWTFGDYATQAFDYATGAIGAIPGLGDLALAGKTAANVAKWGKRIMTIPAVWDMASHTPGATEAIKKAISGENLTVEDWRNLGSFVRGLTATRNITVQNRAARRAMEKRGYDISNQNGILKRTGLWDTSLPKTQTTVKVNVKGKQEEIQISPESKSRLDKELKKAGNDKAKKDEAIRNVKEVKEYKTNQKLKEEDITAIESSAIRNAKYVPRQLGTTKANYGKAEASKPSGDDTFEAYLSGDRGVWDRIKYGSNRTLRAFDPLRGVSVSTGSKSKQQSTNDESSNIQTSGNSYQGARPVYESKDYSPKAVKRDYRNIIEKQQYTKNQVKQGTYKIFDEDVKVSESSGRFSVRVNGEVIGSNLEQQRVKELISIIIKENKQAANKISSQIKAKKAYNMSTKDIARYLKDLKKMGWLKRGGQINNFDLDKTISEFLNKQK